MYITCTLYNTCTCSCNKSLPLLSKSPSWTCCSTSRYSNQGLYKPIYTSTVHLRHKIENFSILINRSFPACTHPSSILQTYVYSSNLSSSPYLHLLFLPLLHHSSIFKFQNPSLSSTVSYPVQLQALIRLFSSLHLPTEITCTISYVFRWCCIERYIAIMLPESHDRIRRYSLGPTPKLPLKN